MPSFGPAQRSCLRRHRDVAFEDHQGLIGQRGFPRASSATVFAEEDPKIGQADPSAQSGIAIPPMEGVVTDNVGDPNDVASP
jgi:hypothetical protein